MKQLKKTLLTLVALLAVTTGAWATTVTWVTEDFYGTGSAAFTKYDVTLTPSNNDARLSNFFYGNGVNTFTSTLGNFTKIEIVFTPGSSPLTVSGWTYEVIEAVQPDPEYDPDYWEYTSKLTWTGDAESVSIQGKVENIQSITFTIAEPSSGPEVAWNKAEKTGTFTMPGGNVTLEPEYYPQANLAFQGLTAAEDAAAKTEAPLAVLADGAVTGGTLMYYVATDKNFSQADAIALAEDAWSAAIPTAETIEAAGTCYVWYYIKGDAEHSDTDPIPLVVTLLPEPTYTVEFAEGTPETDKWKADPNADVKKDQTVTVTYTGSKKVLGVKAEKKAKAAGPLTNATKEGAVTRIKFKRNSSNLYADFTYSNGSFTRTGGSTSFSFPGSWTMKEENGVLTMSGIYDSTINFVCTFYADTNEYTAKSTGDWNFSFTGIEVNGNDITSQLTEVK